MRLRKFTLALTLAWALSLSGFAFATDDDKTQQPASAPTAADQNTETTATDQAKVDDKDQAKADNKDQAKADDDKDKDKKSDEKKVKAGSKDDVEAIGNRDVGSGRGLGNWYSLESDIKIGKQYAQQIESSVKLVTDPVVNEYVNRVGQNLVRNSDAQVPFTIKVVDSDEVNAFALPGGFFYVNSGLVLAADEEAELAGVMAHEIAHVAARHGTRGQTRANLANIATIPLIFVGGGVGYAARSAAGIGLPLGFLKFSRGFEEEADFLGVQYMYKAGYDPQAYVAFFEKLQAKEKKKPGTFSKAFSSHPQTPDRIENSQKEIARILPAKEQYIISTSEFDDVKTRLAALENRRKITDEREGGNRPTLRRTSNDKKDTDNKDSKEDDDRPTLKRRDDQQ